MQPATIERALDDFRSGRMIIVVDDEDRENEGDLVMAAERVTPEAVNFMTKFGRGLLCVALTGERVDALGLPLMVEGQINESQFGTAFTVSVDARQGITTGISAHERALTIRALIDPNTTPADLAQPGHVFPLRARDGGVFVRAGHTEAAVDLARLADLRPAGVICEILADDGTMARLPELMVFAQEHDLTLVTIEDLIAYRRRHEMRVRRAVQTHLPTDYGTFALVEYEDRITEHHHLALIMGDVADGRPVLTRIHSECLTGDVFGSERCDCGDQLALAMEQIATEGRGVILYLRQEGRGIGLHNKLLTYVLQDQGFDTVEANERLGFPADQREYDVAAHMLRDLGVQSTRLMTNNPTKVDALGACGLTVVERVPLIAPVHTTNRAYLQAKQRKLGHLLEL